MTDRPVWAAGDLDALTAAITRLAAAVEHSNVLRQADTATEMVALDLECSTCSGAGQVDGRQCLPCVGRGRIRAEVPA